MSPRIYRQFLGIKQHTPFVYFYVRRCPQPAGSVRSKGKSNNLELHGQHFLFAAPVVNAVDLIEILLVPGHVDTHGPPFPVDGQRVGLVQASDKTTGVILVVVQLDKADHALNRFGPQGLRVAIPLALSRLLRRGTSPACKNRSAAPLTAPCLVHWTRSPFVPSLWPGRELRKYHYLEVPEG